MVTHSSAAISAFGLNVDRCTARSLTSADQ
jgi:hypothetical protein